MAAASLFLSVKLKGSWPGHWDSVIWWSRIYECQRINSTAEWVWVHEIKLLKDSVNKYLLPFHKISHWTFSHWFLYPINFPLLHKWTVILVEDYIMTPPQTEGQRCSWLALTLAFLPRCGIVTNSVAIHLQVYRWSFPPIAFPNGWFAQYRGSLYSISWHGI